MRQELMTAMNNDELQNKWKNCIRVTCYVFRTYEMLRDFVDRAMLVINHFIESLKSAFSSVVEKMSEVFEDLKDFVGEHKDFIKYEKIYPPSYTPYVDNLKLNTRGFPQPITRCARSRC